MSIHLCFLPSLVNTTQRYINFSTRSNVFPLNFSANWLGFPKSHNTSAFPVPICIRFCSHAAENRPSACWRSCSEDASSTNRLKKTNGSCKRIPSVIPRLTRLWLSIQLIWTTVYRIAVTAHIPVRVPHLRRTVAIYPLRQRHKLLNKNAMDCTPVTGVRQDRTPAILPKRFLRNQVVYLP